MHLRFTHVAPEDETALARAFQALEQAEDFEITVTDGMMDAARTGTA